jgi:hypothetical protein
MAARDNYNIGGESEIILDKFDSKKVSARFCRAKDFGRERDKMVQNFVKTHSFSCYIKLCILLPNVIKGLNKICLDYVHFA